MNGFDPEGMTRKQAAFVFSLLLDSGPLLGQEEAAQAAQAGGSGGDEGGDQHALVSPQELPV